MKDIQIVKVEYDELPYVRLLPKTSKKIYSDFEKANGFWPRKIEDVVELFDSNPDYLYLFIKDCKIKVTTKYDGVFSFIIKAGAFTDLASVPDKLKSAVDDNAPEIIAAAIVHDFLYKTHYLGFDKANIIFKGIIKVEGGSWWFRFKAYRAVNTFIGKHNYNNYDDTYIDNRKYFNIKWEAK